MTKGSGTEMKKPRIRRTPDQARELVLTVAAKRLAEHGIAGLNITDVAKEAGISHANLLHHFGSASGMQRALVAAMDTALLQDILEALQAPATPSDAEGLCRRLFAALARDGHGKLLAWAAVTDHERDVSEEPAELFDAVVRTLAARRGAADDLTEARYVVLLVATAAIGSVITPTLAGILGMSGEQSERFPDWLAGLIGRTHPGITDRAVDADPEPDPAAPHR